jgi:FRG domain
MPVPTDWYQRQERVLAEHQRNPDKFGPSYDELFSKLIWVESASSWQDLIEWLRELQGRWGFRGQRESRWPLRTSLDRAVRVETSSGHYHIDRRSAESELLFRFQQQAHQFIRHLPDVDDKASWIALMQHYGVPTRLLDWTRSPYVALYFAVEGAPQRAMMEQLEKGGPLDSANPAIWAIDLQWLKTHEEQHLGLIPTETKERTNYLNGLLDKSEKPLVVQIDPLHANERMFAQQGFFLWKLFEGAPYFDQILTSMVLDPILVRPVIRKLEIHVSQRIPFLEGLRSMNIHRASLFPGLDGFCQSLKLDLEIKVANESIQTAAVDQALEDAFGKI